MGKKKHKKYKGQDLTITINESLFDSPDDFASCLVELMLLFKDYGVRLAIPTELGIVIDADDFPDDYTLEDYLDE